MHSPSLIMRKTSDWRYSTEYPVLKIAKVMKNKDSLRNCCRPEETGKKITTKCNVVLWIGSCGRNRALMGKKKKLAVQIMYQC